MGWKPTVLAPLPPSSRDEVVDAVAAALFEHLHHMRWGACDDRARGNWRKLAKVALDAAEKAR